jgi:hypothetical protein
LVWWHTLFTRVARRLTLIIISSGRRAATSFRRAAMGSHCATLDRCILVLCAHTVLHGFRDRVQLETRRALTGSHHLVQLRCHRLHWYDGQCPARDNSPVLVLCGHRLMLSICALVLMSGHVRLRGMPISRSLVY